MQHLIALLIATSMMLFSMNVINGNPTESIIAFMTTYTATRWALKE